MDLETLQGRGLRRGLATHYKLYYYYKWGGWLSANEGGWLDTLFTP